MAKLFCVLISGFRRHGGSEFKLEGLSPAGQDQRLNEDAVA